MHRPLWPQVKGPQLRKITTGHHRDKAALHRSSFLNHPHRLHSTNKHCVLWLLPKFFFAEQLDPGCIFCVEIKAEDEMRHRVNIWKGLGENLRQQRAFPHVASSYSSVQFRDGCQMCVCVGGDTADPQYSKRNRLPNNTQSLSNLYKYK